MLQGVNIETFLQYGVLGIMGWIFIQWSNKMFERQNKRDEMLLKNLLEQKSEPNAQMQETLNMILQTLHSQNKYLIDVLNTLSNNINQELSEKKDIWRMFLDHEQSSQKRNIEWLNLLNSHKILLVEMKKNCGFSLSKRRIGERLVEKGYIDRKQLAEVMQEQEEDELAELNIEYENKK